MATKTITVPVVLIYSREFAGKNVNLPHVEQAGSDEGFPYGPKGNKVSFGKDGIAITNTLQASFLTNDSTYAPFCFEQNRVDKEYEIEVEDEPVEEKVQPKPTKTIKEKEVIANG